MSGLFSEGNALDELHGYVHHRPGQMEWGKSQKHFRVPAISDIKAGDLEDIGILVGEVYDEKIIEEMLAQGAGSYSEES